MMGIMMMEIMVCHAGDDGDHAVPRRWRSKAQDDIGHIMSLYDLHVMFVMFIHLICLERR